MPPEHGRKVTCLSNEHWIALGQRKKEKPKENPENTHKQVLLWPTGVNAVFMALCKRKSKKKVGTKESEVKMGRCLEVNVVTCVMTLIMHAYIPCISYAFPSVL